jgi:hypothetical protein
VQAQIGHIDEIHTGYRAGDYFKFTGESSDWSNTQTITLGAVFLGLGWVQIAILVLMSVVIAVVVVVAFVYLTKKRASK